MTILIQFFLKKINVSKIYSDEYMYELSNINKTNITIVNYDFDIKINICKL